MADVSATLRKALGELEAERARIERQIAALKAALGESGGARRGRPAGRRGRPPGAATKQRRRRKFSAAQRKEVSRRMKAYWAKRRAAKKTA
jgi:Arc/MetJ-type ribon-helix-helix transcriptional regulator